MAAIFFSTLWSLRLLIPAGSSASAVASPACGVTCSTDYKAHLNCSCASAPTRPLRLHVNCSDGELHVVDSCRVTPPRSWCVMRPPALYDVAAVGTECTATVSRRGDPDGELSSWALYDAVKPPPPSNVRVLSADGSYNITWDHSNERLDCLTYRLRIRAGPTFWQDAGRSFSVDERFLVVRREELPPRAKCSVAVQAKLCPGNPTQGPWSEWSFAVKWTTAPTNSPYVGVKGSWLYVLLAVVAAAAAALLLLGCSRKPLLLKRLQLSMRVSKPHDFFEPLYLNHRGNFKDWVKPGFSEHDFLENTSRVEMTLTTNSAKQQLQVHKRNASSEADEEPRGAGRLVLLCAPSAAQVSIRSVTLCGEERRDGSAPNHGELPDFEVAEERAEGASLASERRSDDGYPRVDLDTVDSGFGECASPSHSGSGDRGRDFLPEPISSRSNYVKQWMMRGDARGEDSENALH
ncbi:interleukin-21 receptor-like isoform X2 [Syngnathoides biaculeatus]|nr:interleukin-21 receptor-like isoform X2 [Syngnathoides biaculeatus]